MSVSFPNESPEYREARNALLDAEIALRAQIEEVAKMRRALPPGGALAEDYEFTGTDGQPAKLSSLFGDHDTLALYSFMYAPGDDRPCPACTSLMDGWAGQATQFRQRISFAAVSSATPNMLRALVKERSWRDVPFYSASGTDYMERYYGIDDGGRQRTFMNVFVREDGNIRHFWGSELERAKLDGHPRHLDTTWPIWGILDLTPEGRGDFFPTVFEATGVKS